MEKQINKWIKIIDDKDVIIVDIKLDLDGSTPKVRYHEGLVRELLIENGYNPGSCLRAPKVLNNKPIGKDSSLLSGAFKFVNDDYIAPKAKPRPKMTSAKKPVVTPAKQNTKSKE